MEEGGGKMSRNSQKSSQYLDPRWQKRRLEILEKDGWKCIDCKSATKTLNVHHRYYVAKRDPWQYPDWALITLCRDCHKELHDTDKFSREGNESSFDQWEDSIQFLDDRGVHLERVWYACTEEAMSKAEL